MKKYLVYIAINNTLYTARNLISMSSCKVHMHTQNRQVLELQAEWLRLGLCVSWTAKSPGWVWQNNFNSASFSVNMSLSCCCYYLLKVKAQWLKLMSQPADIDIPCSTFFHPPRDSQDWCIWLLRSPVPSRLLYLGKLHFSSTRTKTSRFAECNWSYDLSCHTYARTHAQYKPPTEKKRKPARLYGWL